jgi:hypothetical protein
MPGTHPPSNPMGPVSFRRVKATGAWNITYIQCQGQGSVELNLLFWYAYTVGHVGDVLKYRNTSSFRRAELSTGICIRDGAYK